MKYYVYILARPDGSVFYVGKGSGKRIHQHEQEAERGCSCHKCNVIRKTWRSGSEIQKSIVFHTDSEQAALSYEIELIRYYGRENLTNLTDGGDGASGRAISEEGRLRIGEANRRREHSLLSRIKKSVAGFGRRQSDETREKIRNWHIGKVHSEETRARIAEASKGRITPEITERARLANTGRIRSDETKAKIGERSRNRDEAWRDNQRAALRAQQEQRRNTDPAYELMFNLLSQGVHPEEVVERTGLSVRTVYRWKKEWGL